MTLGIGANKILFPSAHVYVCPLAMPYLELT